MDTENTPFKDQKKLFGHPVGLYTLFFAEMWERFSYYGMRALLVFYMIKGFLGLNDEKAYGIYGAYTALVYMTPYFGGMLADRLLGRRHAVVIGGLLMAAGHLLMTIEASVAFFLALALLIAGNGFFKPNISTIVGELYDKDSPKKDIGFTIFYMGINLGAAMSPIVCGYVGETYGWHYGFGLATIGMLIGVAVFVAPTRLTQILIGGSALTLAIAMPFWQDTLLQLGVRILIGIFLLFAAIVAVRGLNKGNLPKGAGAPPDMKKFKEKWLGPLTRVHAVYIGIVLSVILLAFIVQQNTIAGWILNITGVLFLVYIIYDMVTNCKLVERHRLVVVLVLFFFNMLFWAFFEQAGSSLNNWTDRNIDRVIEQREVKKSDVGKTLVFRVPVSPDDEELAKKPLLSQEQLGHVNGNEAMQEKVARAVRMSEKKSNKDRVPEKRTSEKEIKKAIQKLKGHEGLTMTAISYMREVANSKDPPQEMKKVEWKIVESNIGMGISKSEIPASEFQAANPMYILMLGLLISSFWGFLAKRNLEPNTPVKFAIGLAFLGLGFAVFWWGAQNATPRGMTSMAYLLLGWMVITTGELALSPVGLSMVTKLSPGRLVSTIMGGWFLATAFSNYLAGIIATFTGVSHGGGESGVQIIPPPTQTVDTYGDVFGLIALTAIGAGLVCLALSPLLKKWMHGIH